MIWAYYVRREKDGLRKRVIAAGTVEVKLMIWNVNVLPEGV